MRKYIYYSLAFLLILVFFLWNIYLPKNSKDSKEVVFSIEKGQDSRDIGMGLEKQGMIRWSPVFRIYVITIGISGKLQAGSYLISSNMSMVEMARKFSQGDVINLSLVVPEGYSIKDIEKSLGSLGLNRSLFSLKAGDFKSKFSFLEGIENYSLEGFLFPDTYRFSYQDEAQEIAEMMLSNFGQKITPGLKNEIKRQGKSLFDIIRMASLIEKEVKTLEDKKIVSGILWKRLRSKMPLQVDATVTYLTGDSSFVSKEDTSIDSPYNTYKYLGLPYGPICNPGLESIEAAVYPKSSAYWYYLSTPEGKTIFSRTLEEHNAAKYKYLKNNGQ